MRNRSWLDKLVLSHIKELMEKASSELVSESTAKERGHVGKAGNPLCSASSYMSDAQRWLGAFIDEDK